MLVLMLRHHAFQAELDRSDEHLPVVAFPDLADKLGSVSPM
ncbi:hypothetical protein [Paenibacillus sp. KR2-11]